MWILAIIRPSFRIQQSQHLLSTSFLIPKLKEPLHHRGIDIFQPRRRPPRRFSRLPHQPRRHALHKIRMCHKARCELELALKRARDIPALALAHQSQRDRHRRRAALEDGLVRLARPLGDVSGRRLGGGERVEVRDDVRWRGRVVRGEDDVDGGADGAGELARNVGGEPCGEFGDGGVDDGEASGVVGGVAEVELGEARFEVGEGGGVDVVGCDAVVAGKGLLDEIGGIGDGAGAAYKTFGPFSCSLVRARYVPISPSSRGRKKLAPTSGKKPMVVSGMAKIVFSVAIRKGACTLSPTPPPMVIPSINAT